MFDNRLPKTTKWAITVVVAFALLLLPLFTNDYGQYVINLIVVYCAVAVGFNIVLGYLGQLAFANAAFFGIGAYSLGILMTRLDLPFDVALIATGFVCVLVGALVGLPAIRLRRYYLAIVTLAFGELMRWIYIHADALTNGSSGLRIPPIEIAGYAFRTDGEKYYLILVVTALVIWLTRNVLRSRIGRNWTAIRENELAVAALGTSPAIYTVMAFAWSGFVVGIAGALFAVLIGRVDPGSFGLQQLLTHFAIVMVGGLGNLGGSIVGAFVLTAAPEALRDLPGIEEIVFSLLIIGVLLFMPRGIAGLFVKLVPSRREKLYRE